MKNWLIWTALLAVIAVGMVEYLKKSSLTGAVGLQRPVGAVITQAVGTTSWTSIVGVFVVMALVFGCIVATRKT